MNSNIKNLLFALALLIIGLLFASCTKQDITTPDKQEKVKAKVTPDRIPNDTFVKATHTKLH